MTRPIACISNLNHDAFLTIIDNVTRQTPQRNIHRRTRPLVVIRYLSQVCRQWRDLMIASSWIWGRVVDLDVMIYGSKRIHWMEEVFQRSRQAPLWIFGTIFEAPKNSQKFDCHSFFIRLLESWERIEILSVIIRGKVIPDSIQRHFLRRSPLLKVFEVEMPQIKAREPLFFHTYRLPTSTEHLFGDYAPLLQEISADKMAFKVDAPWLSTIRKIDPIPQWLSLTDVFGVLQHAINLESVVVRQPNGISLPPSAKLSLIHLSSIHLKTCITDTARILGQIILTPWHKLLSVNIGTYSSISSSGFDPDILSLKQYLPIYIANYFASNLSSSVLFHLEPEFFRFCDCTSHAPSEREPTFAIFVDHDFSKNTDGDAMMACLVDMFVQAQRMGVNTNIFKSVTAITLDLYDLRFTNPDSNRCRCIYSMLALFDQIESLTLDEVSGDILWTICKDGVDESKDSILFPRLQTLYLTSLPASCNKPKTYVGLTDFFLERKRLGFPVAKFDLTSCGRSKYVQELSDLEEVNGLQVAWKRPTHNSESGEEYSTCVYICGTGDPQQLKASNIMLEEREDEGQ